MTSGGPSSAHLDVPRLRRGVLALGSLVNRCAPIKRSMFEVTGTKQISKRGKLIPRKMKENGAVPVMEDNKEPANQVMDGSSSFTDTSEEEQSCFTNECRTSSVLWEEFLSEWNDNPHPNYITPDHMMENSKPHFECKACGDKYKMSISLQRHLTRKSFSARLPCPTCKTCHLSYNRCSLILRAQKCDLDVNASTISSLSKGEGGVKLDVPEKEEEIDVPLTKEEMLMCKEVCPECQTEFKDSAAKEEHFSSGKEVSSCPECSLSCLTPCGLKAHKRLHTKTRPFVCPECGTYTDKPWSTFNRHVTADCHHYNRIVGYSCSLCPALLLRIGELAIHIVDAHGIILYRCHSCPMGFVNVENFESHHSSNHPETKIQYWVIHKCPLCEGIFASSELVTSHIDSHLTNCSKSLFKCSRCDSLQSTRTELLSHLEKSHSLKRVNNSLLESNEIDEEIPIIELDDEDDDDGFKLNKAAKTSSGPSEKDGKKLSEHKSEYTCAKCNYSCRVKQEFRKHIVTHRPVNKDAFQCMECGMCYITQEPLLKHFRFVHEIENPEKFFLQQDTIKIEQKCILECTVCSETFSDERTLNNHMKCHGMAFLKTKVNPEKIDTLP